MRAVIQRVSRASVRIDGQVKSEIGAGLLVLLAVGRGDTSGQVASLADKVIHLRIFDDPAGKMNLSLLQTGGAALVVSQFTLYGDTRRGRRPGFEQAAPPDEAYRLYEEFTDRLKAQGVPVHTGVFRAHMTVELVNDGPVTLILDSRE